MKAQVEEIPSLLQYSFICQEFRMKSFDHPFHFHPELEITLIKQSTGSRIVGDHIDTFEPGDLCLIGKNLPHIYRNTTSDSKEAVSDVIQFSRDCANGFLDIAPELSAFSKMLDSSALGLKFDGATADKAEPLFTKIREAQGISRWTHFLELAECLLNAPDPLVLASSGYTQSVRYNTSNRMTKVCQYIMENFDKEISHEQVANKFNMSPAHFSRLFKKTTRKTYKSFLTEVRLGHTCRLLTETNMPILQVALESGFQNLSSFNRQFLQNYKCTPREYRQRHRS